VPSDDYSEWAKGAAPNDCNSRQYVRMLEFKCVYSLIRKLYVRSKGLTECIVGTDGILVRDAELDHCLEVMFANRYEGAFCCGVLSFANLVSYGAIAE
jgi:hypothetical protein